MSMGKMNKLKINDTITNVSIKNISNRSAEVGRYLVNSKCTIFKTGHS